MTYLNLSHLEKSFGQNHVVKDFNLSVEKGEFISLLGPSGCGKTTVLRMIAGFETPSSGAIIIDGQDVTGLKASARNIGMMFQAYALFPNLTVAENVGFGLKVKGVAKAERKARVSEILEMIGLPEVGGGYRYQLTGGQQQRVALARALAPRPRVLLLDEPLSALDAKVRVSLRNEIRSIQQELGITTIFVTHDQEEGLSVSDRIVVMNAGVADQVGTPFEIYNRPQTRFAAGFVGTLNLIEGKITDGGKGIVDVAGQTLTIPGAAGKSTGATVTVALRPEALRVGREPDHEAVFSARVRSVQFMGSTLRIVVDVAGQKLSLDAFNRPDRAPPKTGETIEVSVNGGNAILLD